MATTILNRSDYATASGDQGKSSRFHRLEIPQPSKQPADQEQPRREQPSVSLVVPAMNEAKNIAWVLLRVPDWVEEIILVDGNSTDGTAEIARSIQPDIVVVDDPGRGKGAALRAGFAAASGDFIVMLDADGSMDPQEIGRYAAALSSDFELVKGSRFMTGGKSTDITMLRHLGNGALRVLLNRLYGAHLTDLCYGYCAFRRDCLPRLNLTSDGFEIETEIAVKALNAGLRICEVPSDESPRGHGDSNLNTFRDGSRVLRLMLAAWLTPKSKASAVRAGKSSADETAAKAAETLTVV